MNNADFGYEEEGEWKLQYEDDDTITCTTKDEQFKVKFKITGIVMKEAT